MNAPDTIYIAPDHEHRPYRDQWFQIRGLDTDLAYVRADIAQDYVNNSREMASAIAGLVQTVEAQKAEIARLMQCLKKANEGFERFERLWYLGQQALETYGRHTMACVMLDPYDPSTDCTCGFTAALKGEA